MGRLPAQSLQGSSVLFTGLHMAPQSAASACNLRAAARPMSSMIHKLGTERWCFQIASNSKRRFSGVPGLSQHIGEVHVGSCLSQSKRPDLMPSGQNDAKWMDSRKLPVFSYSTWTFAGSPSLSHQVLYLTAWNEWLAETPEIMSYIAVKWCSKGWCKIVEALHA